MDFRIFITDTTSLEKPDVFCKGMEYVSKERREKVERIKQKDSKRQSLAAGILFEYACSLFKIDGKERKLSFNDKGKPAFAAKNGYHFNLSHSGKRAMCALAETSVGCDVEHDSRFNESFIRRFFEETEASYLMSLPTELIDKECSRLWTLKESYMKCDGRGIALDPAGFSVTDTEGNICLKGTSACEDYVLFNLEGESEYHYSCAIKKANGETDYNPIVEWVDLEDILK